MDIKLTVARRPYECRVEVNGELMPVTKAVLTMEGGKAETILQLDIPIMKPLEVIGESKIKVSALPFDDQIGRLVYKQLKERYEKRNRTLLFYVVKIAKSLRLFKGKNVV